MNRKRSGINDGEVKAMEMSAQKAEMIYDQKQVLQSIKDHILKLEVRQTMDQVQGLPKDADLESQICAARSRLDDKRAEIEQMERDYQDWLRENP